MSELRAIVRVHLDKYGGRSAALARRMGTATQTLDSWKNRGIRKVPDASPLKALARGTDTPYEVALDEALHGSRYLPEEVVGNGQEPAPDDPPLRTHGTGWNSGQATTDAYRGPRRRAGLPANGRYKAGEEPLDSGQGKSE